MIGGTWSGSTRSRYFFLSCTVYNNLLFLQKSEGLKINQIDTTKMERLGMYRGDRGKTLSFRSELLLLVYDKFQSRATARSRRIPATRLA